MEKVVIPGTNLSCSKFIFGTASLFSVGLKKERVRLLEAAIDNGFSHFDTAPYYGFGMAERDLASVLKHHPHVTVTTKVGIYSPGGENQSSASIFLRKSIGRAIPSVSQPTTSFDLNRARLSLDNSLRRLGRSYVDLYMLHEPKIDLLIADSWYDWLEAEVKTGRVGAFGLALTADKLDPFLQRASKLSRVVQMPDSIEDREADILTRYGAPLQITYGYISSARSRGNTAPVAKILEQAAARNSQGAIIVSTTRVDRLSQYSKLKVSS